MMAFPNSKKHIRIFTGILLSFLILLSAALFTGCSEDETTAWLNEIFGALGYEVFGDTIDGEAMLKMHVIDVGQGDSVLVQCGECNVLIDCGENGMGTTVLDYLHRAGVSHLDWLIGTHPHSDHIGGMDTVLKSKDITVDHVMMPQTAKSVTPTTITYTEVLTAIKKKKLKITRPVPGTEYDLDGVTMLVLSPEKGANYEELNDYSIVLKFTYRDVSILTGGDASKLVERQMITKDYDLSADIYKVSHHGGRDCNSEAYLNEINPRYAAISVGENKYGHPKSEILKRLKAMNCEVYRTDLDGDIIFESDGSNISVVVAK
ncbi:MAG: MBL fold metallo-hydrolase [Clostridia bacterium]|nr:MBL fold metallo-hydrolase [Clostridia bacterium]